MIETAKGEGLKAAERTFAYANEVERSHVTLYQNLLDNLGKTRGNYPYYVCPVRRYTVLNRIGKTQQIAEYITEGIRIGGHNAEIKKISDIKDKKPC